ncbi:MAG: mannitol dehydrogenase [Fimbriimonadaceae bacterium]
MIFGAGNIGRGFLGQLFHDAAWEVVFVEANPSLVQTIRRHPTYPVRLVDNRSDRTVWVGPVRCVGIEDRGSVLDELATADLAATAVGPARVRELAQVFGEGARRRLRPLDVLLAENLWNAAEAMRSALDGAGLGDVGGRLGWVESSIGRMVPFRSPKEGEHPLLVVAEPYDELPVDERGFLGPVPRLPTLRPASPFEGYMARKLFVHNAGHACAAYLGAERGHETIWSAVEDAAIRPVVEGAMQESAEAIHRRYGLDREGLSVHVRDLLERFSNRPLHDTVARVAANPIRKLGADERFFGAIRLCLEQGVEPRSLARGALAAFRYRSANDPDCAKIEEAVASVGPQTALSLISGVPQDDPAIALVLSA